MSKWSALAMVFGLALTPNVYAAYSQDVGKIAELYVNDSGNIAVRLDGGFPNAIAAGQCSIGYGWAGRVAANSTLKAALLAAKSTGSSVTITTLGCETGSDWLKILDVYIK